MSGSKYAEMHIDVRCGCQIQPNRRHETRKSKQKLRSTIPKSAEIGFRIVINSQNVGQDSPKPNKA